MLVKQRDVRMVHKASYITEGAKLAHSHSAGRSRFDLNRRCGKEHGDGVDALCQLDSANCSPSTQGGY